MGPLFCPKVEALGDDAARQLMIWDADSAGGEHTNKFDKENAEKT
jgi:hypothetical protein